MARNILLVDDERDSLEPMRVILEDEYNVLTSLSGEEALQILERETVEMIIADQRMPGMTGVELLTRARELYPGTVRVVLTAYSDFEAMLKAINEGRVYRYIIKPWDVDDMRLVIRQALEYKDLVREKGQLNADLEVAHKALAQRTVELERAHQAIVKHEKLAAVGQFAAELVHEMNNYLQVILGLNASLTESMRTQVWELRELATQTRTLADIVAGIRDFSLGAALPFSPELASPVEPAREVIQICRHHPDFRGLTVRLEHSDITLWRLDGRQLKHLLLNLLKNAARASTQGHEVLVEVFQREDELIYRVVDHGTGIPQELRARIFEPFYTTRERTGTGLGLSICKEVAEAHGGHIEVEDTPDGGTTFIVRIPRL